MEFIASHLPPWETAKNTVAILDKAIEMLFKITFKVEHDGASFYSQNLGGRQEDLWEFEASLVWSRE